MSLHDVMLHILFDAYMLFKWVHIFVYHGRLLNNLLLHVTLTLPY